MLLTTLLLATSLSPIPEASLEWHPGPFMSAVGQARAEKKPVMLYFWSGQSEQCHVLWKKSLSQPKAAAILDDFTMYSADTGTKAGYKLVEKYNVTTLPTLLILDADGQPNDVILGAIDLKNLGAEIARIESGEGTLSTLRASVAATPADMETRGKYAVKLADLGLYDAFVEQRAKIYGMDPKFEHVTTAEFRVQEIQKEIKAAAGDEGEIAFEPLTEFLGEIDHKEIKYKGWAWVASVADHKEDRQTGKEARFAMWANVPEKAVARDGFMLSQYFYGLREDLTKKEKRFALEVAQEVLASVEAWCDQESASEMTATGEGEKAMKCPAKCMCDGCAEGCVGEGEKLASRKLYVARASENLALIWKMNGKRKDALAAIDRSIELDPENEAYAESRAAIKKRS